MDLNTLEIFFKLFLACFLGGIIGLERESVNRPAGFRTHILVSIGATIVMITNMELVSIMSATADVQPGRFGAAVISGIGFLGAGTIIKEGSTVKGLTTAASLWATACIGLALGSGLYTIAIGATAFVFFALEFFPILEMKVSSFRSLSKIQVSAKNEIGQLSAISSVLSELNVNISSVKTLEHHKPELISIIIHLKCPSNLTENQLIESLIEIKGIYEVDVNPD